MPNVTLYRSEWERDRLPGVCLFCGSPTTIRPKRRFLVAEPLVKTQKIVVGVPLCAVHAKYWSRQNVVVVLSLLAVVAGGFGVFAFVADQSGNDETLLLLIGWIGLFVGWLIFAGVYKARGVRATKITPGSVRLTGVHAAFIDALTVQRAHEPQEHTAYGDERDDYDDARPGQNNDYLPRRRPMAPDEPDDRPRGGR